MNRFSRTSAIVVTEIGRLRIGSDGKLFNGEKYQTCGAGIRERNKNDRPTFTSSVRCFPCWLRFPLAEEKQMRV
ncbi:hypothetical protein TIFTF001_024922 [Ficus carica]|uniref:Uncharacterized protein n=1 Tax=Ficus carica TaxID=3494 RepID=A0AA88AW85_FICCA|nr:hypothetical protein TIFTF001_024922 [Ficus carica]